MIFVPRSAPRNRRCYLTTLVLMTSWERAFSGYAPTCCLGSRSRSSWPFGRPSETADDAALWRYNHDSERPRTKGHAGADLVPSRPAGSVIEVERMQCEVLDYLTQPATSMTAKAG